MFGWRWRERWCLVASASKGDGMELLAFEFGGAGFHKGLDGYVLKRGQAERITQCSSHDRKMRVLSWRSALEEEWEKSLPGRKKNVVG